MFTFSRHVIGLGWGHHRDDGCERVSELSGPSAGSGPVHVHMDTIPHMKRRSSALPTAGGGATDPLLLTNKKTLI